MICIIVGSQGSGKTLLMTKYAIADYFKGKKIYSNYKLNFPSELISLKKMLSCTYNNASIFISEGHNILNNREFNNEPNKTLVKKFIPQIRKQNVNFFIDTQRINNLDKKVRLNCDILINCRRMVYKNNTWKMAIPSKMYDKETPIKIEYLLYFMDSEITQELSFIANPYYDLYDTYETVNILE